MTGLCVGYDATAHREVYWKRRRPNQLFRHVCGDLGERGEDGEDVEANMRASVHYHQAHVECELVARIVQTTCMTNHCRLSIFEAFQSWSRRLVVQQT